MLMEKIYGFLNQQIQITLKELAPGCGNQNIKFSLAVLLNYHDFPRTLVSIYIQMFFFVLIQFFLVGFTAALLVMKRNIYCSLVRMVYF